VHILSSIDEQNQKVSSSQLRQLVKEGEVEDIYPLVHRYYQITGTVIHGDKRGRTIGFPTANVAPVESYVMPKLGVYAVLIKWKERTYSGVMNLGTKPTFQSDVPSPTLEVHLFDFDQELYDEEITIQFVSFIREEQRFASIELLKHQIEQDAKEAKKKLALII
jgi:riboflavin kinase/FMN adenylyltransferase